MTAALHGLAAVWLEVAWPLLWYGTVVGALALAAIPVLRRVSTTAALIVGLGALAKFALPPLAQWPMALVDATASRWLPVSVAEAPSLVVVCVALAHVTGGLVALVRLGARAARVRGWRRRAVMITDGSLYHDFVAAAAALPAARLRAALLVSADVAAPMALGVWRPAVIVPPGFYRVGSLTRRVVFAHELAHHNHRDLVVEWALSLTTAVWWFHPLVHALVGLVRELREERCDAAVVSSRLADAGTYCGALLEMAAVPRRSLALAMRTPHAIGPRVRRLLADRPAGPWSRAVATAAALVFVAASVPAASERWDGDVVQARQDEIVTRHEVRIEAPVVRARRP